MFFDSILLTDKFHRLKMEERVAEADMERLRRLCLHEGKTRHGPVQQARRAPVSAELRSGWLVRLTHVHRRPAGGAMPERQQMM